MDPVTIGEYCSVLMTKMTMIVLSMLYHSVGSKMIDGDTLSQTKIAMDMMYVIELTGRSR